MIMSNYNIGEVILDPHSLFRPERIKFSLRGLPLTSDGAELPCLVVLDVEPGVLHDLREGNLAGAVALVRRRARRRRQRPYQTQH